VAVRDKEERKGRKWKWKWKRFEPIDKFGHVIILCKRETFRIAHLSAEPSQLLSTKAGEKNSTTLLGPFNPKAKNWPPTFASDGTLRSAGVPVDARRLSLERIRTISPMRCLASPLRILIEPTSSIQ
jgi:hypothetical protein